jgi:hypothetical protein
MSIPNIMNTNRCESHEKGNHLPSLCMLNDTRYTSLFTIHTMVRECKLYNTHSYHFTFQAIFLKERLLMKTEQICDCIHYLTKHIIMEAWVKIVDSILHHQKWISKMRFTCLFLYSMTHFLHITVQISLKNMTHNLKNVNKLILYFTIHTIFLWPYIIVANIKCSFVGQLLIVYAESNTTL